MDENLDHVWKALSDPTRRAILDELRVGPRTTTELVALFPDLTRFAVMKHMDVLRDANLMKTKAEGRHRINSLNVLPIRQIYERWVSPFEDLWASKLLGLKRSVESKKDQGIEND
jgi:DNA-binding transcriptional ArsR family regulator